MSEFKVIETQEQLEAVLKDRLERERATVEKKYADYESLKASNRDLEGQITALNQQIEAQNTKYQGIDNTISALNQKVLEYETASAKTRIALETGLPYALAGRLAGSTEEELRADAENLRQLMTPQTAAPLATTEPAPTGGVIDSTTAAYRAMLNSLRET